MAMHACQIGPTELHLSLGIASLSVHWDKGERFGARNLSGLISPLFIRRCDYILFHLDPWL